MPDLNDNGQDDVVEVNDWLLARGLRFLAWVWRAFWKAAYGVKALFAGSAVFIYGLIEQAGGVDLLNQWRYQVQDDNPRLGKYLMGGVIAVTVLGFLLKGANDHKTDDEGESDV